MSQHRYLYAYANPTVYIDPDGRAVILSDMVDFFERRRTEAIDAAVFNTQGQLANSGFAGEISARTGSMLTSVGAGIFGTAEYATRTANFGANIIGDRIGFISDKAISELDQSFRTIEGVAHGAVGLGRDAWNDPIGVGRRSATAVSDFGHAVFIEGDPNAQAQFGAGVAEAFAGGALARGGAIATRQSLSVADAAIRRAGRYA